MSAHATKKRTRKEVRQVYENFRTPNWLKFLLAGLREKSRTPQHCRD